MALLVLLQVRTVVLTHSIPEAADAYTEDIVSVAQMMRDLNVLVSKMVEWVWGARSMSLLRRSCWLTRAWQRQGIERLQS